MAGVRELGRCDALGDAPLGKHRDAVGDGAGEGQVVGDDDLRGAASAADTGDQLPDLLGEDRIQIRRRLVIEDQLGIDGEGAGDGDPLAHAAGELARKLGFRSGELDLLEDAPGDRGDLGRALVTPFTKAEAHVLGDRERGEQRRTLEHHGDAEGLLLGRHRPVAGELDAAERDPASVGVLETDDLPQQDRLARAALPDDRQQFARLHDEVDAAEDRLPVVDLAQAGELHADAAPLLRRLRHQSRANVIRTMRKSKTRIRMKLQTTAAVVDVAMPSVPPRVRRPKVQGTIEATMPKIVPFSMPTTKSLKCTHSSIRSKYVFTGMVMAGSRATTAAPPQTPMKSAYRMRMGRAIVAAR